MARPSLQHVRTVLAAEFAAIRNRDPDIDAGDVTSFTMPLLLGLLGVLAIGVVPLIVVRSSARTDSLLVPLAGSPALAAIYTAVVAWLTAIVLSGLVVMVLYRTRPKAASRLVLNTVVDSFGRVEDITGRIALLAIVAGLLSLAIGLPNRHGDESGATVLDDLLAAPGYPPELIGDVATDGVELIVRDHRAEDRVELLDLGGRLHAKKGLAAVVFDGHDVVGFFVEVEFVFDVAHDLLENIFDRDQTGYAPVFIDHHR